MRFHEIDAPPIAPFQLNLRRRENARPWSEINGERDVQVLFLPTTSSRRKSLIYQAYRGTDVRIVTVASELDEPLTSSPEGVVQAKLDRARFDADQWVRAMQTRLRVGSIAGDVLMSVDGHTRTKPKSMDDIRDTLKYMADSGKRFTNPHYTLNTACGVWRSQQDGREATIQSSTIEVGLFPKAVDMLNTSEGFDAYITSFEDFHAHPLFGAYEIKPPSVMDVNGGVSLEVLTRMGCVEHINGTSVLSAEFPDALTDASRIVMSGYTLEGMEMLHAGASDRVRTWDYLPQVAALSLPTTLIS